jgi:glycosyltransferase involved in cell wall biosynthesis/GR25 family glycosyltransferase involved in LPS biosynthesis
MKTSLINANKSLENGDFYAARDLYIQFKQAYPKLAHLVDAQIAVIDLRLQSKTPKLVASGLNDTFENIYLVNMEKSRGDRLRAQLHLNEYGLNYKIWNGIDGYTDPIIKKWFEYKKIPLGSLSRYPDMNEREVWRKKHYIESPGALGYIYTYLSILADAKKNHYKNILILEDDIILSKNFESQFSSFINSIPADWKLINLGSSQYHWDSVNKVEAIKNGWYTPVRLHTCGSFAIGIDNSIYELLIDAASSFESPFDLLPMGEIYQKYPSNCFVAYPNIVMPDVSSSNIRSVRNQFSHSKLMDWRMSDFNYPLKLPIVNVLCDDKEALFNALNQKGDISKFARLRIFVNGKDGLRPIHSNLMDSKDLELLDQLTNYLYMNDANSLQIMPPADLEFKIKSKNLFSAKDVYDDLQNKVFNKHKFNQNCTDVIGRVTVVIPTYKRIEGLRKAVLSIIDQDYEDIEIIIVDDNGCDSPVSLQVETIFSDLKKNTGDKILRLLKHTLNRNGAAARNTGIFSSTGEYICFLDDDDIYLKDRVSKSINALESSDSWIGAVYCGFLGWNSPTNDPLRYPEGDLSKHLLMLDYKKHYIHTNTITYKKSAVLDLMGFDESFNRHQDLEFNLRFFQNYRIKSVPFSGVRLKVNPESVDNRQLDINFYFTKRRFLQKFKDLIYHFDDYSKIIQIHKDEVLKNVPGSELSAHNYSDKNFLGI